MRISVTELKPGMKTSDWEVLSEPRVARRPDGPGHVVAIDMRHRVDCGESTIYYEADAFTDIE